MDTAPPQRIPGTQLLLVPICEDGGGTQQFREPLDRIDVCTRNSSTILGNCVPPPSVHVLTAVHHQSLTRHEISQWGSHEQYPANKVQGDLDSLEGALLDITSAHL